MSNFVCRSLTFQTPEEGHTHTHAHTLTLQITYCLVKQKFFITFHKLRLFIRDHNFVLCIFFIPNIFRTAPSSFRASLIFFSIFLLFSKAHTLSRSLSLLLSLLLLVVLYAGEEIETLLLFCIIFLWQQKTQPASGDKGRGWKAHSYATASRRCWVHTMADEPQS